MKTLEYVKKFMDDKVAAWEQVEANPDMYDEATKVYAKALKDSAVDWYMEMLKEQDYE